MGKLLFYHFQVTNLTLKKNVSHQVTSSKLKNKKFHLKLLTHNLKIESSIVSY